PGVCQGHRRSSSATIADPGLAAKRTLNGRENWRRRYSGHGTGTHRRVVHRPAARIIAAFTADETSLTVTEIARRTGLHIATASRLIAELTTHGLLARGPRPRGLGRRPAVGARGQGLSDVLAARRCDALPRRPARGGRPPRPARGPRRR